MGRDPVWGCEVQLWGHETNWLDKSDIKVFVNFTRKFKVGLP